MDDVIVVIFGKSLDKGKAKRIVSLNRNKTTHSITTTNLLSSNVPLR